MGREARCRAIINGEATEGTAYLETDAVVLRGEVRAVIPYRDMAEVQAESGRLTIEHSGGTALFELGEEAELWAHRIRNPKTLVDKLGIKPDHKVVVLRVEDDGFLEQLRVRGARVVTRATGDADAIFFGARRRADLGRLDRLKSYLKPDGALWVVRRKGGGPITENEVMAGGKEAGLVDVKVVRFSETHTAEKFVIPVAERR
ncbi:MAG: hypothetical protein ABR529_13815 [Actinomycetota bacterium]